MTNDQEYNGWTNYETWRVNLEWFDGTTLSDLGIAVDDDTDSYEVGTYLHDYVEAYLYEQDMNELFRGYVQVFFNSINWQEIAEHMIEDARE